MIKELELNGFKSFISDNIEFGNLTVLTGLNSSGKSSVIQALLLAKKAVNGDNLYLEGHGNLTESRNSFVKDGIFIKCFLTDDSFVEITNEIVSNNNIVLFPEIIHVSADRFGPETSIPVSTKDGKLGRKGENIFKAISMNEDKLLPEILRHRNSEGDTFLFNLRAWLGIISPNVTFESFIQDKSDSSYSEFNGHRAKNVGFGLSYSLPVITALLLGSITNNCMVIIENPEAHLHPRGQTEMANLISLCVESGVQVVIETHSDHLFDGIRLFAKKNEGFYDKVKSFWFELDAQKNTEMSVVKIDSDGRIKDWPSGMFDQFSINSSQLL